MDSLNDFIRLEQKKILLYCCHIQHSFYMFYNHFKKTRKLQNPVKINTLFITKMREILVQLDLHEYIDVICVVKVIDGVVQSKVTLHHVNESEFGVRFVNHFNQFLLFLDDNLLSIRLDDAENTYYLENSTESYNIEDELLLYTFFDKPEIKF